MEKPRERRRGRECQSFEKESLPRNFVRAIGEPLVVLRKPRYTFEAINFQLHGWECDRSDANLEMRDKNPQMTYEEDRESCDRFLSERQKLVHKYEKEHPPAKKTTAAYGESSWSFKDNNLEHSEVDYCNPSELY